MTQNSGQKLDEFYEAFWQRPGWNSTKPNGDESARYEVIRKMLVRMREESDMSAPLSILDLGCGRGWLSHLLAREGRVIGIDPVRKVIETAQKTFPEVAFRTGTVDTLLTDSAVSRFDLVVCSEVIEHVPNEEKPNFLQSVGCLLKPGGYMILTTPRGEMWEAWRRLTRAGQPVEDWISESELTELCLRASFSVVFRDRAYVVKCVNWQARLLRPLRILAGPLPAFQRCADWAAHEASIYQIVLLRSAPGTA